VCRAWGRDSRAYCPFTALLADKDRISYLSLAVGIILAAGAASQLVTRLGFKPPLIAGLLLIAGGLLWFSQVPGTSGSYAADVLGPSILAAVGLGFSFVAVTIAAVTGTEPHEAGLVSGLINDAQQVGGALPCSCSPRRAEVGYTRLTKGCELTSSDILPRPAKT
jgi:hypothetical protein